jgi:ATP-dependent RNA helicase HelY
LNKQFHHHNQLQDTVEDFLSGIGVPEKLPFVPDQFQLDAIKSLNEGNDTLVIAPTGSGKTYIAFEAIHHALKEGKRAVYTAPLKALSNAKFSELKKRFEPEYRVGLLTGDRKIEGDAHVVVATTEIYRNELYRLQGEYSVVVLDEFHYLSDPQRGPVWEESIILCSKKSTLLMLSASISNSKEIAEWIEDVRRKPVRIVTAEKRPVELRLGFIHPRLGVIPLEDDQGRVFPDVAHFYDRENDRKFDKKRGGRERDSSRGRGAGRGRGRR